MLLAIMVLFVFVFVVRFESVLCHEQSLLSCFLVHGPGKRVSTKWHRGSPPTPAIQWLALCVLVGKKKTYEFYNQVQECVCMYMSM